ncbi:hypothetical protein ACVWYG_001101 [Pedobacter sp. UYEF25]
MKKFSYAMLLCAAVALSSCAQKGYQQLSKGATIKGWHTYNKNVVGAAWTTNDGVFHLDPTVKDGGGDLVTDKEYSNFDLTYDWKVAPGSNSGLIFYVHEDPKYSETYTTGIEMQVIDNDGHPDGKNPKHRAGDLYDLISSSSEPVKPVGEWNRARIVSDKGNLTLFLNGVQVVKTTMWDESWSKLVAGSKFANWKDWGTFHKGKIALQDHGGEMWYKNISIKEL